MRKTELRRMITKNAQLIASLECSGKLSIKQANELDEQSKQLRSAAIALVNKIRSEDL